MLWWVAQRLQNTRTDTGMKPVLSKADRWSNDAWALIDPGGRRSPAGDL